MYILAKYLIFVFYKSRFPSFLCLLLKWKKKLSKDVRPETVCGWTSQKWPSVVSDGRNTRASISNNFYIFHIFRGNSHAVNHRRGHARGSIIIKTVITQYE